MRLNITTTLATNLPAATAFDLSTSYWSSPLYTSTLALPSAGSNGTLLILKQSAGTITYTSFLPQESSTTYTQVLTSATNDASGIVVLVQPSAGTVTTSRTYGPSFATSTLAYANGTTSGTVRYDLPEPTITTTSFLATNASTYVSIYPADGTSLGSVVYGQRMAGENTYTVYAVATATQTITLQAASGTTSGVVEVIIPSYYSTLGTSYYTGTQTATSVVSQPSGSTLGTESILVPYASTFLMQISQPGGPFDGYFVLDTPDRQYVNLTTDPIDAWAQFAIGPDSYLYAVASGNPMAVASDIGGSSRALLEDPSGSTDPNLSSIALKCYIDNKSLALCRTQSIPYYLSSGNWWISSTTPSLFLAGDEDQASTGGITNLTLVNVTAVPLSNFLAAPFPGYQIETTYVPTNSPAYTATIAGNQAISATIVYGIPSAPTVTTTITSGSSDYTTTVATGFQTSAGTVQVVLAQTTVTTTSYLATDASPYTSTVPQQKTTPGTILVGQPSAGYSTATVYGAAFTTVTATLTTASGPSPGYLEVSVPTSYTVSTTSRWSSSYTSTSIVSEPTGYPQVGTEVVYAPLSNLFTVEILGAGAQTMLLDDSTNGDELLAGNNAGAEVQFYLNTVGNLVSVRSGFNIVLYSDWAAEYGGNPSPAPWLKDDGNYGVVPITCTIDYDNDDALSCIPPSTGAPATWWYCGDTYIALAADENAASNNGPTSCVPITLQAVAPVY